MIAAKTSVVSTTSGPDADGMKVEGTFQTIRGNWIHDNRADDDGNSCKVWNATSGQYENYSLPHFDGIQLSGSGASNLTIEKNIIDLSNIYLNYKDDDRVTPVCQTESNTDIPRRHQGCWATYLGVNPKPFLPATSYDGTLKKDVCIVGGTTYTTTADIEDHCCVEGCYTGGVYISGGGTNIVNVRNNIIRSCQPIGLYNINGGSVVNNTLIQGSPINSGHGIQIYSSSQGIQVSNNIVYGASPSLWENYLSVNSSTSITASNNLYFNIKDKIGSGYTTASGGDINDNPDFTNYASKAYSLLLGSPAINAGWPISGLTEDILGATRPQGTAFDIGAYEYPQSVENPVDGSCGTANGAGVTSAPTSSLCSTGTTSAVSGSGPWTWTCTGSGGGATASCSAPLKVDGVCNSNTIGSYTSSETFPRSSYCSAGTTNPATPTNPAAGGSTSWTCVGLSGGATSVMCTAIRALAPINGACGTAAKTFTYSDPFPDTYTICATGTASAVSPVGGPVEGGSATWTCTGLNNGTTSGTCTATRTASPGACGEAARAYTYSEAFATSGWCVTGTANPAAPTNPAQGGSSTWNCVGSTTVSCTAERAAAPIIGSCGTAISTNHIFAYNETFPGSYTYCAKGTANPAAPILAVGGTTTWMCNGLNGGGNSGNCTAQKAATPINGQCNTSTNGVAVSAKPTTNLCTTGTASTVSGSGPWTWTCTGS
ncbi:MAG: right-handed parallel beta-helix repeat-containing protein, partial [Candidatus Staskawiczbacteria bacterium]|nr:right-handed parallel beta-helix repeat-containing protein [Candidatus Staskawiczbacteria bacterium]